MIKQIKGFYSLSDCAPALECKTAAFKSPVFFDALFIPLITISCNNLTSK